MVVRCVKAHLLVTGHIPADAGIVGSGGVDHDALDLNGPVRPVAVVLGEVLSAQPHKPYSSPVLRALGPSLPFYGGGGEPVP